MGFPYAFLRLPKTLDIKFLLDFTLSYLISLLINALTHLRLLKPPSHHLADDPHQPSENYILISDRLCPSPVPVPVSVLMALIKKRLPVVKYGEGRSRESSGGGMCPVCLDSMKEGDEIRELCNCAHVFHRECLDGWVDSERVTCPTCRSMLFPDNNRRDGGSKGLSWLYSDRD